MTLISHKGERGVPGIQGLGWLLEGEDHSLRTGTIDFLFLLGQSFSLSMGRAGGRSALSITWPDLFVLVWFWLFLSLSVFYQL